MTTVSTAGSATKLADQLAAEPKARFRDLIAAEWIKLWSLRSTPWVFGLSALVIIAANANAAYADYSNYPGYSGDAKAQFIRYSALGDAFTNNAAFILMLAAGSIGAIMIVSEFGTGLIRTTFAAVPARRSVMAAKLATLTGVMLGFGIIVAAVSFWVTEAILSGRHVGVSLSYPGALRVIAVSALLAPVSALIGMGIGTLIRHSATTIATTFVTLLLLPLMVDSNVHRWVRDIHNATPFSAWERLTFPLSAPPQSFDPATVTGSWIVYAIWPLAAVAAAVAVVRHRDL